jgi:hypothetical protein
MKLFLCVNIIFPLFFFQACAQKENFYLTEFNKEKTINLALRDNEKQIGIKNLQYVQFDHKDLCIINFYDENSLWFFDMKDWHRYHEIKLADKISVMGFSFINKDSIFVLYGTCYGDSALQLINYEGKTMKKDYLKHQSIYKLYADSGFFPYINFFDRLLFANNNLYFPTYFYPQNKNEMGTKDFNKDKYPIITSFDCIKKKLVFYNDFWYPYIKENIYYPVSYSRFYLSLSSNNFPLFRFPYSSMLFELNTSNHKINSFLCKSSLIDSIYPSKAPIFPDVNTLDFKYSNVFYDPYRELYYSFVSTSEDYNYKSVLMVADKNFKILGEAFNHPLSQSLIFTKEHIISLYYSFKSDSLVIDYFYKPLFKLSDKDSVINSMKEIKIKKEERLKNEICKIVPNDSLKNNNENYNILYYFKNKMKIKDTNFIVISMYNSVCRGCYETILTSMSFNATYLKQFPVYLIISGKNGEQIKEDINLKGLSNFKNIFIDSLNLYEHFDPYKEKSTRLTYIKSNNIVFDKLYLTGKQEDLMYKVLELINKEFSKSNP